MSSPIAIAATALREYLLRYLPAEVAAINATRAAVVKAALAGPYAISSGSLSLGPTRAGGTSVTLPTGVAVTASTIATAINAAVTGITASADTQGRLVLTSDTAPTGDTASAVGVGASEANAVFGWEDAGVHEVRSALGAPTWKGVMDGWPVGIPDGGRNFVVILEDRDEVPLGGYRRDEHTVTLALSVWAVDRNVSVHRSREYIQAAAQAVRDVLESDDGRTLGLNDGTVQHVAIGRERIRGMPFQAFDEAKRPLGPPADVASMTVQVKVFQRPSAAP